MGRKRSISTDISIDESVDEVAQLSDFAALLYTWMIPHADEDATITGSVKRLMAMVMPYRRDKKDSEVEKALGMMHDAGLFEGYDPDEQLIYFPIDSFYKYQSSIHADKRRTAKFSGEQRRTAKNSASFSSSFSSSVSKTPCRDKTAPDIACVIDYLNTKAGRSYKPTSKPTVKHINARLSEGFTLDDFKTVIDFKVSKWRGDPEWEQYLRPDTLFGTKFESYLQAAPGRSKPRVCIACGGTKVLRDGDGVEVPCMNCGDGA